MKNYEIAWDRFHPKPPKIVYVDSLKDFYPVDDFVDNAVACFLPKDNKICILSKHKDNLAIKIHEYGHWFFVALYFFLDELWEVIWWHFGIRKLFINKETHQ